VAHYRGLAEDARRYADEMLRDADREAYLRIAARWESLARDIEDGVASDG
jgi:hypothetical protein